ncbi:MAG: HD domain-containing protein [Acidobacteriota bacterium]|nr:HD domain-containing protein [Blastocatellia bacterium]MDW8413728.1 HD domain-containing protein [Acidobacteriota bacterium]
MGKLIRDAVHKDMWFSSDEIELIDTPQMQRLRGIKQLGHSYLVYPAAVHTRFEHSLGTCWMAKRILESLRTNGKKVDPHSERIILASSLLHDITHIPFGHTFEDERRLFDRHDEDKERLSHQLDAAPLKTILKRQGIYEEVASVLGAHGNGLPQYVYQIVAGTVCADLLDYLKRDAYFCGLSQFYDDRLFQYFTIDEGQFAIQLHKNGLFRHDALSELINLLRIRYTLTERVYYHHAKAVAAAMLSKALEIALESNRVNLGELLDLRDDSFLYVLRTRSRNRVVTNIIDALENRCLYKRVYLLALRQDESPIGISSEEQQRLVQLYHFNYQRARTQAETQLAEKLGLPQGAVIIYCPSSKMALKEAAVPVKVDAEKLHSLAEFRNAEVTNLLEKHRRLWRFFVCIDRRYADKFDLAGSKCEELFGQENMLRREQL